MSGYKVVCADVLEWAKEYDGPKFHALICDPQYALSKKKPLNMDAPVEDKIESVCDLVEAYHSLQQWGDTGFMNKAWDDDLAFDPKTWRLLSQHLYPGAFLFAFASSRGWHRLACAMEDAGLILQPSIFVWGLGVVEVPLFLGHLQAQAFPKASRIDVPIDKAANRIGKSIIKLKRAIRERFEASGLTLKEFNEACGFEASGYLRESSTWATVLPSHEKWQKIKQILDCDNELDEWFQEIEREIVGKSEWSHQVGIPLPNTYDGQRQYLDITAPATPLARAWEGHRYGGQILKDALSPIIVAQKPWEKPRLDCIVRTGTGAINVDAGRIAASDQDILDAAVERMQGNEAVGWKNTSKAGIQPVAAQGRWPSNFALIHSGGCVRAGTKRVRGTGVAHGQNASDGQIYGGGKGLVSQPKGGELRTYADPDGMEEIADWRCEPDCVCEKLGEMSGRQKSGGKPDEKYATGCSAGEGWGKIGNGGSGRCIADKGTAARFYHQSSWEHERAEMQCSQDCPISKLDEQAGESISSGGGGPTRYGSQNRSNEDTVDYPENVGYGDEGGRSRYFHNADWSHEIAERLATSDPVRYCPKAAKSERSKGLDDFFWRKDKQSPTGFVRVAKEEWEALGEEEKRAKEETGKRISLRAQGNIHPTIKPLSLTKWLASLLSPPKEYAPRRLLVPFAGVASEMCGAILSGGFEEVIGIEMIPDYVDIAEARAAFWSGQPVQLKLED